MTFTDFECNLDGILDDSPLPYLPLLDDEESGYLLAVA